jgi:hypothetical protein
VRVTVKPPASGPSRDELAREIRRIFPRLHELKWAEDPREEVSAESGRFTPKADFASNVRNYLTEQLGSDPDKELVLALADEFLRVEAES